MTEKRDRSDTIHVAPPGRLTRTSRRSVREVGEAIALLGVIASLVFVGLELRENRIAARAAAYQELGIAVAENETVYLQVEQKLLAPDALDRLGWHLLLNSRLSERMWPEVRAAVTPAFVTYLESQAPALRGD